MTEALNRLGYSPAESRGVVAYVTGARTLEKAPGINHAALHEKGFDKAAVGRVEDYLVNVNDIRLAVTPWVVGAEFCRKKLKIPAAKINDPRFDLLQHLGFSAADITAANTFCYGHTLVAGAKTLRQTHAAIFACGEELSLEARILMASAVQGFVSGDAGLTLSLFAGTPVERSEFLLLTAWRQGVKSVTMIYEAAPSGKRAKPPQVQVARLKAGKKAAGKIRTSEFLHTKSPAPLPVRGARPKAGSSMVSMGRGKTKASQSVRGKRG
jgi:hypothetical protein